MQQTLKGSIEPVTRLIKTGLNAVHYQVNSFIIDLFAVLHAWVLMERIPQIFHHLACEVAFFVEEAVAH